MMDLAGVFPLLVEDEFKLLTTLVDLESATIVDVGCGAGQMTLRMAAEGRARRVLGVEVDAVQLQKNLDKTWPPEVAFAHAGAQALPVEDGSVDGLTFFKSLHHVPDELLGAAFHEMRRVLKPGGWVFISEPVFAGSFNEIVRLFHDEEVVRAQALRATDDAVRRGLFVHERRVNFQTPVAFTDFADFRVRLMNPTHSELSQAPELVERVRQAFDAHQTPSGARFIRPMRVDLLAKPA